MRKKMRIVKRSDFAIVGTQLAGLGHEYTEKWWLHVAVELIAIVVVVMLVSVGVYGDP